MSHKKSTAAGQPPLPPQGSLQTPPPPPLDMDTDGGNGSTKDGTGLDRPFQLMQLKPKDIVCDNLDATMISKKGIILQYLNYNSTGATTMIGVTRIGLNDARKMPAYVSRNIQVIRQHAVNVLQRHLQLTQCSTGALETLCAEDYSISFSWASVTEAGRQLTQNGRPDLALGYAMCDHLVAPVRVSQNDPHPTYVLNVYVQLQEPTRRRNAVVKKAKEDEALKANPPPKRYATPYRGPNPVNNEKFAEQVASFTTKSMLAELKRPAPVCFSAQDFPVLIGGNPPEWNRSGLNELPDDLDD
jgi:hypothetical protein